MTTIELLMYAGRRNPSTGPTDMDGQPHMYGFTGPTVEGITMWSHYYGESGVSIYFENRLYFDKASKQTGWAGEIFGNKVFTLSMPRPENYCLPALCHEGKPAYYGQWRFRIPPIKPAIVTERRRKLVV